MSSKLEKIEYLNSFGPFTSSEWEKNGIRIGNEEGLRGRSKLLLSKISNFILERYSEDEIRTMSLIDIGSFDGFFACNLANLNFKRVVGAEPRIKNIDKGNEIRNFLDIKCNVEFQPKNLHEINDKFDIVLCLGVMHHVPDHYQFIKKLVSLTKKTLIIDTRVLRENFIDKKKAIFNSEMLDVYYKVNEVKDIALSIDKIETSFKDTSSSSSGIVSLPNKYKVCSLLNQFGFTNQKILIDPIQYRETLFHNRPLDGLLLAAEKKTNNINVNFKTFNFIINYENKLRTSRLPKRLIEYLYSNYFKKKPIFSILWFLVLFLIKKRLLKKFTFVLKKIIRLNDIQLEILENIFYSPHDKILYESAKEDFHNKNYKDAETKFKMITQKMNSDYRSVYRSFYYLYKINKINKNLDEKNKYFKYYFYCIYGKK